RGVALSSCPWPYSWKRAMKRRSWPDNPCCFARCTSPSRLCVVLRSSSAQSDECKVVGADNPQGDALNLDNLGLSHRLCSERAESRYELYRPIANPDSLPFGTVAFGSAVVVDRL